MYSRGLFLIICSLAVSKVLCFSIAKGGSIPSTLDRLISTRQPQWRLASSKEDEIRELEEKLQKLKEEAEEESAPVEEKEVEAVDLNEQAVFTELLTEQWKETDDAKDEGGGILKTVGLGLAGIGLVVGLVLFSQVPIGQEELSKYSPPTRTTSTQIDLGDLNRARQSGDI